MATVGITNDLINRTESIINSMKRAELASELPNYDKNITVDASQLYIQSNWSKEHMHLCNAIPKDWLTKVETVSITMHGDWPSNPSLGHETGIRIEGLTSAYARPSSGYWGSKSDAKIHIDDVRALPEDTPGRAECITRWEESLVARDIIIRWDKIRNEVESFLRKCKSLNEAVKLFPAIKMYIDRGDIERLERKVERPTQRKKIVEDVPTGELTAAAMAARLTGVI